MKVVAALRLLEDVVPAAPLVGVVAVNDVTVSVPSALVIGRVPSAAAADAEDVPVCGSGGSKKIQSSHNMAAKPMWSDLELGRPISALVFPC